MVAVDELSGKWALWFTIELWSRILCLRWFKQLQLPVHRSMFECLCWLSNWAIRCRLSKSFILPFMFKMVALLLFITTFEQIVDTYGYFNASSYLFKGDKCNSKQEQIRSNYIGEFSSRQPTLAVSPDSIDFDWKFHLSSMKLRRHWFRFVLWSRLVGIYQLSICYTVQNAIDRRSIEHSRLNYWSL